MQYFFILGKNPLLSKAEIEAVMEVKGLRIKNPPLADELSCKVFIVETDEALDVEWLNGRLGGTVKIGKVLAKVDDLEEFEDKFFQLVKFGEGKAFFGFSLYPLSEKVKVEKYQKRLQAMAMDIKARLRDEKHVNSRYVVSREVELSSVIVAKNKLLKNGAEICFFIKEKPSNAEGKEIIFGQTLAVQLFEEFGARDFNRPGRDNLSGMLPPKLARIMVNLAQIKDNQAVVLDPFCGSGTILQEALLMGYENVIGFDNSERAIEDTKRNLEWLEEKFKIQNPKSKVIKADVRNLAEELSPGSVDAIVTEPYLGPPLRGNESPAKIKATIAELEALYLQSFGQFAKVLKPGGKVVVAFPVFHLRNSRQELNILSQIQKMGFNYINKEELLYYREKQFVWRNILLFEKS